MNPKQEAFVLHYCRTHNGTKAAIAAGYSKHSAGAQASKLLKVPHIRAEIKRRTETFAMTVDEALRQVAIETSHTDPSIRLKALDMILKAGGAYKEERNLTGRIVLVDETPGPSRKD